MLLNEFKDENKELIEKAFSDVLDALNNLDWVRIDNILNNWILEAEERIKLVAFPAEISTVLTPFKKGVIKNYLYYKIFLRIGDMDKVRELYEIFNNEVENLVKKVYYFNGFIVDGIN